VFSSPGEGGGEERVAKEEEDGVVMVVIVDKDDEPVRVIPMSESTPPRPSYKQTTQIWIHRNPSIEDGCKRSQPGLI
jgi:hypothetical protein